MTKHELPSLPYGYDALEPHIDSKTMEIHHSKHHKAYTDKLNAALEKCSGEIQNMDIDTLLSSLDSVPSELRGAINFNGGGFDNHALFWPSLSASGGGEPGGALSDAITASFGNFADFKTKFSSTTAVIQGSGWGWLVYNKSSSKVEYVAMSNQDSPKTRSLVPLLGLDVWEHAYYLNYQNRRPDYIAAWWNIINWDEVATRFSKAL